MGDDDFDREMANADWAEVWNRQAARGDLVAEFASALSLDRSMPVVDIGSGPGYGAIRLAERVAPAPVSAVDRQLNALRFCRRKAAEAGTSNLHAVVGDAESLPICPRDPVAVLLAFVLHHAADPAELVAEIGRSVPVGSRLLVAEYDPAGSGEFGPPADHRIGAECVCQWLADSALSVEGVETYPEEKYTVTATH